MFKYVVWIGLGLYIVGLMAWAEGVGTKAEMAFVQMLTKIAERRQVLLDERDGEAIEEEDDVALEDGGRPRGPASSQG